jgi:hypothetical protein
MRYRLGKWAPDMRLHAAAGRDAVRALGTLRVRADVDELDREAETLESWLSKHKLFGIAWFPADEGSRSFPPFRGGWRWIRAGRRGGAGPMHFGGKLPSIKRLCNQLLVEKVLKWPSWGRIRQKWSFPSPQHANVRASGGEERERGLPGLPGPQLALDWANRGSREKK